MLEARPAETAARAPAVTTGAPVASPRRRKPSAAPDGATASTRAPQAAAGAGCDQLGVTLARAVARRADPARPLLQRVPSTNDDPTALGDGLHWDRQETTVECGKTVPSRITAIMHNPRIGGVPSIAPPGWDWLELHVERLKGNWVRFHIINRLLGGPGNSSLNLVPTSVAVNNAFSRGVETDAKANVSAGKWTYIDVALTYDGAWPAPIPKRIEAEQGTWDGVRWNALTVQFPALVNADITQLAGGPIYLRGDNITAKQLELRGVPGHIAGRFAAWLRTYSQASASDLLLQTNTDLAGFDSDWLEQIWLDEDEAAPGQYTAVVKKLKPPAARASVGKRRGRPGTSRPQGIVKPWRKTPKKKRRRVVRKPHA